jgi:O-antigen ligase
MRQPDPHVLSLPTPPPWVIVGITLIASVAAGRLLAGSAHHVKYGAGIVLVAVYAPLVFFNLPAALAVWTAVLFVNHTKSTGLAVDLIGVLIALGWFGVFARRARTLAILREQRWLIVAVIMLNVWLTLSLTWAPNPGVAGSEAGYWWLSALAFVITLTTVTNARAVRYVATAFVIGGLISAVLGLGTGGLSTATNAVTSTDLQGRLTGGGGDPNVQAAAFVASMFMAMGLFSVYRRPAARAALVVAFIIITVAFGTTESRGGLIALVAATLAALVVSRGQRRRILALVGLAVAVGGIVVAAHPGALTRITNFGGGTSGRSDIWHAAEKVFEAHPIVGVGLQNFDIVEPKLELSIGPVSRVQYISETPLFAHNTYLQLLAENGIIGLSIFLVIVVACLRAAWIASKLFDETGRGPMAQLTRAIMMGTVGTLAADFFITNGDDWRLWILLGLGPALLGIARSGAPQAVQRRVAVPQRPFQSPQPASGLVGRTA